MKCYNFWVNDSFCSSLIISTLFLKLVENCVPENAHTVKINSLNALCSTILSTNTCKCTLKACVQLLLK